MLLETERLVLRRFTPDDCGHLFDLDNDSEVMRYINGGIPISMDKIQNDIMPLFLNYDESQPGLGFFAVVEKVSTGFMGWCCLRPAHIAPSECSIGYRFLKSSWGRGYATEASRALMSKGFTELGLKRITATTYEHNTASRRVLEKLGLKLVRTFKVDFSETDTAAFDPNEIWDGEDVEYAIDRTDYGAGGWGVHN